MNREQSALWQRIESFEIDDPAASFPFSARLANENGWTQEFARRVVDEYKRFVFLMMVAGHEVTPSDEVDQAWHLHLVYTRSYWDELCSEVLGRPLHHGPTKGGQAEGQRFEDQYLKTLASYERWFGAVPPSDIWPPCAVRFAADVRFVRVNAKRYWIVGKRLVFGAAATAVAASLAIAMTGAANPAAIGDHFANVQRLAIVFVVVGLLIVVAIIVSAAAKRSRRGSGDSSGCGTGFFGCSSGCGGNHDGGSGCGASGCGASGCSGGGCGGGGCGGGGCGGGGD